MGPRGRCVLRSRSWARKRSGRSSSDQASAVADADLDRTRTSISCGGSRDSSPTPSANSCYSSGPGDSETFDTEGESETFDSEVLSPIRAWMGKRPRPNIPQVAGQPNFTVTRRKKRCHNNRETVGNVGIFFANWAHRTWQQGGAVQQAKIGAQIKKTMRHHWPD